MRIHEKRALIREALIQRATGKQAYQAADQAEDKVLEAMDKGEVIEVDGVQVEKADQFADRNIVWKPAGVKRWVLRESRAKKA